MHFRIIIGLLSLIAGAHAQQRYGLYSGSLESRVEALASVQPGLGVIMHEFGYRFSSMYWAANGGNRGLAQHELKELVEAQEVAEMTRPKRAEMLKSFEKQHLVALEQSIESKDIGRFNRRFSEAVRGCNACHTSTGNDFIRYRVPQKPAQELLDFNAKTEPKYREEKEPR